MFLGGNGRVDIEVVADEVWVDPWGVTGVLCKHVDVSFKKFDQLFFLLRRQPGPYLKELLGIASDDHSFQIFAFCLLGCYFKRWHRNF